jgi:magnesium chelatase subunit H
MSGNCWPERLIGDLPNIYLYAANNPSEGVLAKRRAAATLVSYLTPTLSQAGLYKGLIELKQSLERWRALDPTETKDRPALSHMIHEQAQALDLAVPAMTDEDLAAHACDGAISWIDALQAQMLELEYALIPEGLHVVGQRPTRGQRLDTLKAMAQAMGIDNAELLELLVDGASEKSLLEMANDLNHRNSSPSNSWSRPTSCSIWTAKLKALSKHWMAATLRQRQVVTCCAIQMCCLPGETCMALTRSDCRRRLQ